jgi:hypothetical protein
LILDEFANMMIKNKQITRWTLTIDEQLNKLKLGIGGEPCIVFVSVALLK